MLHLLSELEQIFNQSLFLGLGVSFIAGILVSLSPCIYPLIPITVGVVGAAEISSRVKGFILSSIFVLGICFTYTILGIISSLFGIFLNSLFVNPFIYLALAVIFLLFGLSLMGIIQFNLFPFSFDYNHKGGKFSLFALGIISGFAFIPCNFPVLGTILSLISLKQNVIYGAIALALFSLGQGLLLIILGTFTSLIRRLPKQGSWLIIIKRVLGILIVVIAAYFLLKFIDLIR